MKIHFLKIFSSFIIGLFFIVWIFKTVHFSELFELLYHLEISYVILGVLFYTIAIFIRAFRWQKLLAPFAFLSYFKVLKALIVGYAMNVILPARLGELFRINLCNQWYLIPRSTALVSVVWERVADGLSALLCLVIGALSLEIVHNQIQWLIFTSGFFFIGITFALFFFRKISIQKSSRFLSKIIAFQNGLKNTSPALLLQTFAMSLVVWLFDGLSLWFIVKSIGISLNFTNASLLVGIVSLSTLIPSPPGYLGTMQFAFGMALIAANQSTESGITAAILTQIFLLGTLTITGMFLLAFFRKDYKAESQELHKII